MDVALIARIEGCSRGEARRLASSVTVEPIAEDAFLYRRGKSLVNWRVVVGDRVADLTGYLLPKGEHDAANRRNHAAVMAHLWRFSREGPTKDLLRSVADLVRGS